MTLPPDQRPLSEWLRPVVLTGRFVRLEPLGAQHAPGIARFADEETTGLLARGGPSELTPAGWAEHIERLNALPTRLNWAVLLLESGPGAEEEVAGRISYSAVNRADGWTEIGTMLTPPYQGGPANPEAKYLLLERAFEVLGAGRVQFRVDARNGRSRAALSKLGAVEEGTLRRFQVRPDGSARDSVMYSLLPEEWPEVKARLQERLVRMGAGDTHV
ncbi:GNAT family N-acetyltransferase [Deinococcus sp.]|uniref:GNAT family N-acetyltransferase n=1 Tax=Deinococcus sp. TaxID=47478 RepID=UPI003CC569E4